MNTYDEVDGQVGDVHATVMEAVRVHSGTQDARMPVDIEVLDPDRVYEFGVHQNLAKLRHGVR